MPALHDPIGPSAPMIAAVAGAQVVTPGAGKRAARQCARRSSYKSANCDANLSRLNCCFARLLQRLDIA